MIDQRANLAAMLTPPGAAAIAVVRLSGERVAPFLKAHFTKPAAIGRCVHGDLVDAQRLIDDPVIVLSGEGRIADISLHGGHWVVRECLALAQRAGFEIVESADDLPDAADPIEREMLAALPMARTQAAVRLLLDQPRLWAAFDCDPGQIQRILDDRWLWWMLHPPRVAIVGAPNAGKSTLANQLFGQDRSITADVPGTTRDWVGDWANLDGLPIHLLDTPGQHDSPDPIEQSAISRSRREIDRADLVILLLDPTRPLGPDQSAIHARYPQAMLVINKSDLPPVVPLDIPDAIRAAAATGAGVDVLRDRIRRHFGDGCLPDDSPRCWTDRQRNFLRDKLRP